MLHRRQHYEEKIKPLRAACSEARERMNSSAQMDPNAKDSGTASRLSRGLGSVKTKQVDRQLGRLWRNEEKLAKIVDRHANVKLEAQAAVEHCLTVVRQQL